VKAGLHGFADGLRRQLAPKGTHVLEVLPPSTDTPMNAEATGKKLTPAQVAAVTMKALRGGGTWHSPARRKSCPPCCASPRAHYDASSPRSEPHRNPSPSNTSPSGPSGLPSPVKPKASSRFGPGANPVTLLVILRGQLGAVQRVRKWLGARRGRVGLAIQSAMRVTLQAVRSGRARCAFSAGLGSGFDAGRRRGRSGRGSLRSRCGPRTGVIVDQRT
jgi:hypothetical protein